MNSPTQIEQSAVTTLLDRGVDFLLEEARCFVEDKNLNILKPSQLSRLQSIFQQNASDFAKQKDEVKKFIDKQVEKDNKRGGEGWAKFGDSLYKRMFEFSDEKIKVQKQVKELLRKNNRRSNKLENDLDGLFNPRLDEPEQKDFEAKEWLEKTLEPALARKMLVAILTVYRCKRKELPIPKLQEE
ncbi:hypothetical protein KJ693_01290 [bacterium]|nr:hypothetical protein [bacterium]MBU1613924.1 hypothetical protein [bacterium]